MASRFLCFNHGRRRWSLDGIQTQALGSMKKDMLLHALFHWYRVFAVSKPEIIEEKGAASFMKGSLLQHVKIKVYRLGSTP